MPKERTITDKHFEASWEIFDYNREFPQSWIEKEINWDLVIDTILENADSDWIYLDLEETLKKISQEFFIKKKYFDKIYASFGKSANNT